MPFLTVNFQCAGYKARAQPDTPGGRHFFRTVLSETKAGLDTINCLDVGVDQASADPATAPWLIDAAQTSSFQLAHRDEIERRSPDGEKFLRTCLLDIDSLEYYCLPCLIAKTKAADQSQDMSDEEAVETVLGSYLEFTPLFTALASIAPVNATAIIGGDQRQHLPQYFKDSIGLNLGQLLERQRGDHRATSESDKPLVLQAQTVQQVALDLYSPPPSRVVVNDNYMSASGAGSPTDDAGTGGASSSKRPAKRTRTWSTLRQPRAIGREWRQLIFSQPLEFERRKIKPARPQSRNSSINSGSPRSSPPLVPRPVPGAAEPYVRVPTPILGQMVPVHIRPAPAPRPAPTPGALANFCNTMTGIFSACAKCIPTRSSPEVDMALDNLEVGGGNDERQPLIRHYPKRKRRNWIVIILILLAIVALVILLLMWWCVIPVSWSPHCHSNNSEPEGCYYGPGMNQEQPVDFSDFWGSVLTGWIQSLFNQGYIDSSVKDNVMQNLGVICNNVAEQTFAPCQGPFSPINPLYPPARGIQPAIPADVNGLAYAANWLSDQAMAAFGPSVVNSVAFLQQIAATVVQGTKQFPDLFWAAYNVAMYPANPNANATALLEQARPILVKCLQECKFNLG